MTEQQTPETAPTITNDTANAPVLSDPPEQASAPKYTEEDLIKARREEKSKLYDELERLKGETSQLMQEREAERKRIEEEQQRKAAEERKRQEEELSVRELLQKKELEWQQQLQEERREREIALEALKKERELMAVQQYRQQQIEMNRDDILPELIDLVAGDSREQVDASIAGLKDRSARILTATQQAAQTVRREQAGARITSPPSEPIEGYTGQQITPDRVRDMSIEEYAKYRESLLGGGTKSQGMFG